MSDGPKKIRILAVDDPPILRRQEIAAPLSVTEHAVKGQVRNILSKLGANDRTQAVTMALKRGIIEL
jgi:DNA-binding NarL/FixJ family response regulator